ncbi:peptidase, partial [Streptomyces sp. NPDC059082]
MKIRRILATAVAAAVTTPVVFLSAAPAFADTKPTSAPTKPASHEDDPEDDMPSLDELKAAVAAAQKAYDEAVTDLGKATEDRKALDDAQHALVVAVADAQKAVDEAAAKKTAADEALTTGVKGGAGHPDTANAEAKIAPPHPEAAAHTPLNDADASQ